MKIVHEDEALIVLDKPTGQLTIPGRRPETLPSLHQEAEAALGQKLWIVHRIDRETSGLVIFAKNAAAHRNLCLQFENRLLEKTYLALVLGQIETKGEISQPLRECGSGRCAVATRNGKAAKTLFTPIENFNEATLLEVHPVTGRRHQIRVHLYAHGNPLVGDPLYGTERPVGGGSRLMLHANRISLTNMDGCKRDITCQPGTDWENEMVRWK